MRWERLKNQTKISASQYLKCLNWKRFRDIIMQRKLKNAKCKRKCLKCMAKWAVIEKCSKPEVHEIFAKPSLWSEG